MKKTNLVILLTMFVWLSGFSPMLAAADSSQQEKNQAVVKKIFSVLETKDHMKLYDLMEEKLAEKYVYIMASMWREFAGTKAEIHDIFASGDRVVVRWTLEGKKDRMLEEDWQIDYISIFRLENEKVVKEWKGDNYWREAMKHGFTFKPPAPKTFEGRLKATMSDIHTIGRAIKLYMQDFDFAPKAASIKELKRILQPFYIKTLPLEDAWENELLYKVDPKNPKNYWIASPGSDGQFKGFDRKGTWKYQEGEKGQDIVLANGNFTYMPDIEVKEIK